MSCTCTDCQESLTLDPWKRVRYAHGLVLGVDEFQQEELRFLAAEWRQNRELHGFGTVCGFEVRVRDTPSGPEIYVAPGLAIDPKGRWIHVSEARCALLNEWLRRNSSALGSPPLGSPPGIVSLFLCLCYRECETDLVPIPGGPCRTVDESMSASRITESFSLDLTLGPPDQTEVEAVRAFAMLLGRLDVVPAGSAAMTVAELEDLVRALAPALSSPPGSPQASPLGSPSDFFEIPEAEIRTYLDAAFRVWVTEVRPALLPPGQGCAAGLPEEGCILLAEISFPTVPGGVGPVVDGDSNAVAVDETHRPYLLHTQLLQELILNGSATGAGGGTGEHGALAGLDQDDHTHYLLVQDRSGVATEDVLLRNLSGDGSARITGLPQANAAGQAMPHGQTAGGDLSGRYPDPTVSQLQGLSVPVPTNANVGQHLAVAANGGNLRWELVTPPSPGGGGPPGDTEEGLVRIFALSWQHNEAHDFRFDLDGKILFGIALAFGRKEAGDGRVRIGIGQGPGGSQQLDLGSLDASSVRLFGEADEGGGMVRRVRLMPEQIVPIIPNVAPGGTVFSSGTHVASQAAPGALLLFSQGQLVELKPRRFEIEVLGDHILDDGDPPRAIDAEFTRVALPTGDRPAGNPRGVQGGHFVSWVLTAQRNPRGVIDINRATATDLIEIGGLSERAAMNVIITRESSPNGFTRFEDVLEAHDVGPVTVERLIRSRRFTVGENG